MNRQAGGRRAAAAFAPGRDACRAAGVPRLPIALDDNTSRFGAPPAALSVLAEAGAADATSYPTPAADALREALAEVAGVEPARIVTGCGSDDVIDCAVRACAREGERLVFPAPTFAMIPAFARNHRMRPVPVPFRAGGDYDVDAMIEARPRVLYLCAPNNPTGHRPGGDLARLLDCGAELVILDQAYGEFARRARGAAPPEHPRLLVTRTLSKAYGLAGLRIGYGVACAALIERIARVRGPYRIGRLAERAAVQVLREDRGWVDMHVRRARAACGALARALRAAGFRPLPSEANFVLVPVARAAAVARRMRARGVRVRAFTDLPGIGDAVRVTAGPPAEMDAALRAVVAATGRGGPNGAAPAPARRVRP